MSTYKGKAKVAVIIVSALAVEAAGFLAILYWGQTNGSDLHESFFQAVLSGEPNKVMDLLHPTLREQVDSPVLVQWMASVKANLGDLRKVRKKDFVGTAQVKDGIKVWQSAGKVDFQKGSAQSELEYRDWRIMQFRVQSERLPAEWFHDVLPGQTPLYRDRGKEFLTHFVAKEANETLQMMHESLRAASPREKLREEMQSVSGNLGKLKSVDCQSEETDGPGKLKILYRLQGEKAAAFASVRFRRDGMKYHLYAYRMNEPQPASAPSSAPVGS